jgi:hypothetical protein
LRASPLNGSSAFPSSDSRKRADCFTRSSPFAAEIGVRRRSGYADIRGVMKAIA